MKHNDCFDDKDCDPIIIGACCDPKVVCPSNSQLMELQDILRDLLTAIPTFLANPNLITKAPLIALFTKLFALLDSLIPSAEVDYLKQLIKGILDVLTHTPLNKQQLIILLQQFYSALADYFFSIKNCFAPSTLRYLFKLITDLIIVTSGSTSSGGAVIPYASGVVPVAVTSVLNGLVSTGAVIGFGSSSPELLLSGIGINATLGDFAFVAPRTGTITSLAAFFSVAAAIAVTGSAQVKLQIYIAPGLSTAFVPQTPPLILPAITTPVAIGVVRNGIQDLTIPVNAGDKILLVISVDSTFTDPVGTAVVGHVSAGITID